MSALIVLAKAPRPGHSKTRLCPPCSPEDAAAVADAALRDTLDQALATNAPRVVLVLDGPEPAGLPAGVEVRPQRGEGLGHRLASAFHDVAEPALLVGMDTPQVVPTELDAALARVDAGRAVLGPARDGGWWALGLPEPAPGAFHGVPMSTDRTFRHQLRRLGEIGVVPDLLVEQRDVDRWDDAMAVAPRAAGERFPAVVADIRARLARGGR